jgi:hypothetical protein
MINPTDPEEVEALRHNLKVCASLDERPSVAAADQAADVLEAHLARLSEDETGGDA